MNDKYMASFLASIYEPWDNLVAQNGGENSYKLYLYLWKHILYSHFNFLHLAYVLFNFCVRTLAAIQCN